MTDATPEKTYANRRSNSGFSLEERPRAKGRPAWRVRIQVTDPATGTKTWQTVGTYPTKSEATREGAKAVDQRDKGTLLRRESATVGEILTDWLENELPNTVAVENRQNYEIIVNKHIRPVLGAVLVQALDVQQVERFYTKLRIEERSGSLIRKCHLRLSSAMDRAVRFGLIHTNPCDSAKVPKVATTEKGIWSLDESAAFLAAAEAEDAFMREKRAHLGRLHPYWHVAIETGARTSELLGLQWRDVDFKNRRVIIGNHVVRLLRGTPILKDGPKTDAGNRTIELEPDTLELLKERRKEQIAQRLASPAWIDNDLVFATDSGRPVNPAHVRRSFDRLVEKSGVPAIAPHGMRRSHITELGEAGVPVRAIAARVGHRDVSTTLNVYMKSTRGMEEQAQLAVAALMQAKRGNRSAVS